MSGIPIPCSYPPRPWLLIARFGLLAAASFGLLALHLARSTPPTDEAAARAWLAEGAVIEWLQVGLLVAALLIVWAGRGPLRAFLALALLATLARELDALLGDLLWKDAHRAVMVVAAVAAAWVALRPQHRFHAQIETFVRTPAFWPMALGTLLVVCCALLLGQNAMWLEASAPGLDRITKRFVEEGLEATGYLWILHGTWEWQLAGRRAPAVLRQHDGEC